MSDEQKTPEQLWQEYESLRATNPIVAGRFAEVHRLHDLPRPASAPPHVGDAGVRLAALRPPETSTTEAPPPANSEAVYAELKKTNPVVAARFAFAHGLHDKPHA